MKKRWICFVAVLCLVVCLLPTGVNAQAATFTEKSMKTSQTEQFSYWLYTPEKPVAGMPLIVYLHGGSGKGSDLSLITGVEGFPSYLQSGQIGNLRAYVVMPQLTADKKGWTDAGASILELIESMAKTYGIDKSNVSLTGHSMGGTGTWGVALSYPATFARIAPLSGSVRSTQVNIDKLKKIPVWAGVGSADTIVEPESSVSMIESLQTAGGNAQISVFADASHFDVPGLAYLNREIGLLDWLIGVTFSVGTVRTASLADGMQYGAVKMLTDAKVNLKQTRNLYLDLNGYVLSGSIQSNGFYTYVKDSQTDDASGYGGIVCEGAALKPQSGYIQLSVDGQETFHRLDMSLSAVVLRPETAGVYYKVRYNCDSVVGERISYRGIAMSVASIPTENFENEGHVIYTKLNGAPDFTDDGVAENSCIVNNILTAATTDENDENGKTSIYARPYVAIDKDGDGDADYTVVADQTDSGCYSMQDVLKTIDANWTSFQLQQETLKNHYNQWKSWNINWDLELPNFTK